MGPFCMSEKLNPTLICKTVEKVNRSSLPVSESYKRVQFTPESKKLDICSVGTGETANHEFNFHEKSNR